MMLLRNTDHTMNSKEIARNIDMASKAEKSCRDVLSLQGLLTTFIYLFIHKSKTLGLGKDFF